MKNKIIYALFIFLLAAPLSAVPQGINSFEFGKNRVQYKDFEWYFYKTDQADIYYYVGGKNLARFTAAYSKKHIEDIENFLDYRAHDKLIFILYNSYSDLRQTNIGYTLETDNPGGVTPIVGNKAFLYYDGNHFDFITRMRRAIAEILINDMLYGGSIQERVQNAALLTLPAWYLEGLKQYIADPWTSEDQTNLKNGILSKRLRKFNSMTNEEKALVGKSLWKYISDVYGEPAVSNIIYLTRINKSLESGYIFVLGKDFSQLYKEWYKYYWNFFKEKETDQVDLDFLNKKHIFKKGNVTQVKLSGDGKYLAYITNQIGKTKVWVYDIEKEKKKKILKRGYKTNAFDIDYNYPLIDWQPTQDVLTVVYEKNSHPVFMHYNVEENKVEDKRTIFRLEKILDFNYSENGRLIALSGIQNGQSDIYVFNYQSNSLKAITRDVYDDLQPAFVRNSSAIVFSSNRSNDTLERKANTLDAEYNNSFDIYYYDYEGRKNVLKKITRTPLIDEFHPDAYDTSYFSYLTDQNGIWNRDAAYLDSIFQYIRVRVAYKDTSLYKNDTFYFYQNDPAAVDIRPFEYKSTDIGKIDTDFVYRDTSYIYPLTDYPVSILGYDIHRRTNRMLEFFKVKNEYKVAIKRLPTNVTENTVDRGELYFTDDVFKAKELRTLSENVKAQTLLPFEKQAVKPGNQEEKTEQDSSVIDINNYYFQSDFPAEEENDTGDEGLFEEDKANSDALDLGPSRIYFLSFTPDYVVTQLDNSIIQSPYVTYDPSVSNHLVSPTLVNAMFKLGTSDLFQDYRIIGGFRIHGNLRGADYFMTFENLKRRLDKKFVFYRKGEVVEGDNGIVTRETSLEARSIAKWPFNERASVRGNVFARRDNTTILSTERNTLEADGKSTNWAGAKLEYVYDNSLQLDVNSYTGTKLNLYSEIFHDFDFDKNTENKRLFYVLGGDIRHSIRLFNQVTWANRFAFATSLGRAKVVYFMGGVDNWLFPQYNSEVQVDNGQNYVYKTLATNLRGFDQNIRNGNTYGLINSELRIPFFKLFYGRPIKSNFFNNFQVVGFTDVGTAWTGKNPFSEENALNRKTVIKQPIKITVINLSNPIVAGYGFGLRSTVLGYFVRLDFAWGEVDSEIAKHPKTYFSFGFDF